MAYEMIAEPQHEPTAGESPRWLGKYEVLRLLGRGGMAELLLGRVVGIEGFEKVVALKRLRPELANDPEVVGLFLQEARLAAALQHPNLVQVYDIGQEEDGYFIAMEYVHGVDAAALLRRTGPTESTVPLDVALSIVIGACAGLHHAHEQRDSRGTPLGAVHCDVSPSNILVAYDGTVKVTDFGIARILRASPGDRPSAHRGKLAYMSPEQCLREPLDRRTDVYSLGLVLAELTTGRRVFDGTEESAANRILEGDVPPPSERAPGYPPELERIILRAISRAREDRHPTAQELQIELEEFARSLRLAVSPVTVARHLAGVCSDEIEAWQAARREGTQLATHLTRTLPESPAALSARPRGPSADTPEVAPRRRGALHVGVVLAALLLLAGATLLALEGAGPGTLRAEPPTSTPTRAFAPVSPPATPTAAASLEPATSASPAASSTAPSPPRRRRSRPRAEARDEPATTRPWHPDALATPPPP